MHCRIFWAAMIVLSILCTLRLIASLIDQISKNPIIIYRDDTPIDITKVSDSVINITDTKWSKKDSISGNHGMQNRKREFS